MNRFLLLHFYIIFLYYNLYELHMVLEIRFDMISSVELQYVMSMTESPIYEYSLNFYSPSAQFFIL